MKIKSNRFYSILLASSILCSITTPWSEKTAYAQQHTNTISPKTITFQTQTNRYDDLKQIIYTTPINGGLSVDSNSQVILRGNGNILSSICFSMNDGSLILEGTTNVTTVLNDAYDGGSPSIIKNLTLDAPIHFSPNSYVFRNAQFNTLQIKKDPAKYIQFDDGCYFGKDTIINELYLDYIAEPETITSHNSVTFAPIGTRLTVNTIYSINPNCNYASLSLKNFSSNTADGMKIYGYGGASAYNFSGEKVLSKEMYEEYATGHGTFINYVKGFQTDTSSLPADINLGKDQDKAAVSFKNISVTGTYLDEQNPANGNTYNHKMTKKTSWDTTNTSDSQYQYGIYVPVKYNPGTSNTYTYSADGTRYALLEGDTCQLPAGTHTYYIEAGGNFEKHTVTVNACDIEEITSITLKNENMEVGSTLTNDDVTVKVRYTNDSKEYILSSSDFSLENPDITKEGANNTVTVVVPREYDTSLSKTITVNGFVDNVNGFDTECSITEMLAGSTLSVNDITLKNITYGNPDKGTTETLKGGYTFVSNGANTNTLKIQPGVNKISVCYGGYVKKDAITIHGYTAESFTTKCAYQTMYAGTTLCKSDITLENIVYNDTKQTKKDSVEDGSFDFLVDGKVVSNVNIHEGKNVIGIRYDGKTLADAITIQGIVYDLIDAKAEYVESYLVDGVPHAKIRITITRQDGTVINREIDNLTYDTTYQFKTNEDNEAAIFYQGIEFTIADRLTKIDEVRYLGDPSDTDYQVSDFYIAATYASGAKKNTQDNPEIAENFSTSVKTMSQQKKMVSLAYQGDNTEKVTATIELDQSNQVVSVSMDNSDPTATPSQTPDTATATPATSTPNVTGTTSTPTVTSATSSPVVTSDTPSTSTPGVTDKPTATSPATTIVTPIVQNTATPTVSPTATPVVTPVKGNTYTVRKLKYKVTSVTKNGGTVTITGYDKAASNLSLPSTVTIGKHKMKVTAIGTKALENCQLLRGTITIPRNVTTIGDKAFYKCKNITLLVVTSKVQTIGTSAFQDCTNLKYVKLYNCTVKKIGKKAFFNNKKKRKFNMFNSQIPYYKKLLVKKKQYN